MDLTGFEEALKSGAGWDRMNEGSLMELFQTRGVGVMSAAGPYQVRGRLREGTPFRNVLPATTPSQTQLRPR